MSQVSSRKEGRMRQQRKNDGRESNANIIPIVKEDLTAFPERLSGNQPELKAAQTNTVKFLGCHLRHLYRHFPQLL